MTRRLPSTDEGDTPIVWSDAEVLVHDVEPFRGPADLVARLRAPGSLGDRLLTTRHAAATCTALTHQPVHVRLAPLREGTEDAWAAITAAWSPRQQREYAGPGWERGCRGESGVLLDDGWVRDAWQVSPLQRAWPDARPWANGFRVFIPGSGWIDAVNESVAARARYGGDSRLAGLSLLSDGSCHAALIGAEWVHRVDREDAETHPPARDAKEVQLEARGLAHERLLRGIADSDPRKPLYGIIASAASLEPKQVADFEPTNAQWRGTPIFTLPAAVGIRGPGLGSDAIFPGTRLPVDPVAWGAACDRFHRLSSNNALGNSLRDDRVGR